MAADLFRHVTAPYALTFTFLTALPCNSSFACSCDVEWFSHRSVYLCFTGTATRYHDNTTKRKASPAGAHTMELPREEPPAYTHNPKDVKLPSVPQHDPRQTSPRPEVRLPDLRSVLAGDLDQSSPYPANSTSATYARIKSPGPASLPRIDPSQAYANGFRPSMESAIVSPSDAGSAISMEERTQRSTSIASLDDPDVRIAAEALSGLGNPGMALCDVSMANGKLT